MYFKTEHMWFTVVLYWECVVQRSFILNANISIMEVHDSRFFLVLRLGVVWHWEYVIPVVLYQEFAYQDSFKLEAVTEGSFLWFGGFSRQSRIQSQGMGEGRGEGERKPKPMELHKWGRIGFTRTVRPVPQTDRGESSRTCCDAAAVSLSGGDGCEVNSRYCRT